MGKMTTIGKYIGRQQPFGARHIPHLLYEVVIRTVMALAGITLKRHDTFTDEDLDAFS
jgi:hypothetical protein